MKTKFFSKNLRRKEENQVLDDLYSLLHALYGHKFQLAVEVVAAGEDVRAGQAHVGEPGAVGAAADGLDLRLALRKVSPSSTRVSSSSLR